MYGHALLYLAQATVAGFRRHKCTHLAAGVAYYIVLSIFPLAIFGVSVLGVVLRSDERRQAFIDDVVAALPLQAINGHQAGGTPVGVQTELERDLRGAINGVRGFSVVGLFGLAGTLWAAGGMFAATRNALDLAWNVTEPKRNFLTGKLVDLMMIGGIGLLLLASIVLTAAISIARNASLRPFPSGLPVFWHAAGIVVSVVLSFVALLALYRFVPDSDEPRVSTVWPGAALGAVAFEALKYGFSVFVENFGNYNEVYGTLAAVVVFLFWSWIVASIVLVGAELSAAYGRLRLEGGGGSGRPPASAEPAR